MDNNQNIPATPDFSDIPALGDTQGLETFLNNQALAQQGLPVQETPAAQPAADQTAQASAQAQAQPAAPAAQPAASTSQPGTPGGDTITLTRDQLNAILAGRQAQPQQQQPVQRGPAYTPQEQTFIQRALARGYSLEQINNFLANQRSGANRTDPLVEQRIAQVEQYLKNQEYKAAESAFVNKLSDFGGKWGLSEQDLVAFGNEALKHGINIAMENVDLEMVFRAVYPEQYAIRSRRMTPTPASQIYGGTSVPEANRASASKLEDAYVEAFLKGAMPNQYGMLNKK